jgi:hypothetical protein
MVGGMIVAIHQTVPRTQRFWMMVNGLAVIMTGGCGESRTTLPASKVHDLYSTSTRSHAIGIYVVVYRSLPTPGRNLSMRPPSLATYTACS